MNSVEKNLPPLTWLRAFEAAARHLSFTRAAADIDLTQSAVSQHVRSLEAFLGKDLFIRKIRALELTEAGGHYLPVVREAFELLSRGTQAFTGLDRGLTMVLQCNLAFSVYWLAPRLHRLYAANPWLVLNIVTPIWDPERHAANAAIEIRFGHEQEMTRTAERLTHDGYFPVCAPDYQGGKFDLEAATKFDCAGIRSNWSTWFDSQGQEEPQGSAVNLTSTYVIAMQAALAGAGMTLTHDTLVRDLTAQGTLVCPFDHKPDLTEGYFLISPSEYAQTPATEAFKSWIEGELNGSLEA
ncbi:MAG: LysR family transcriptional regulator [Pseudomonadota bacterium]